MKKTRLTKQSAGLKEAASTLEGVYSISNAVSRATDFKSLLSNLLDALSGLQIEGLKTERMGALFIVSEGAVKLAAHSGLPGSFAGAHERMLPGDCLCGIAASTGETVISANSENDVRHTINYSGSKAHAHAVIPLKSGEKTAGVLCLYLKPSARIDARATALLRFVGEASALALSSAMLFEDARNLALYDGLTGLANKRLLLLAFERLIAAAKRYGRPLSVIMAEMDGFREFTSGGRTAGDSLLMSVAGILKTSTREADLAARYGEERFVILLPETGPTEALVLAERLRKTVEKNSPATMSFGVSTRLKDSPSMEALMSKADAALYASKRNGGNRVESDFTANRPDKPAGKNKGKTIKDKKD